jgi:hypothetical protein
MNPSLRRIQALLGLAALGVAGMLLGPDIGHRIDIGAIGGALLYGALWLFVVHLAKFAAEVFPDPWSLAEKQAAVGIAFMVLISFHVANLLFALPDLGVEADRLRNSATRPLWINLGMLFFAWTLIASTIRRQESGAVQRDERDLRIAHGAAHHRVGTGAGGAARPIPHVVAALYRGECPDRVADRAHAG